MDEEAEDLSIDELVEKFAAQEEPDGSADTEEVDQPEEVEEEVEEGDQEEAPEKPADEEEAEVDVPVDGKVLKVKIKELKRLYGQEASLTQKSQSVAAASKAIDEQGLYLAKVLEDRLKLSQTKVDKYKDVDLFKASRDLEPDEFDAIRAAKADAEAEFKLLTEEAREFVQRSNSARTTMIREQAKVALVEIKRAIPEWNDKLYEDIRQYAVGQGLDRDTVNEVIAPGAVVMMHKAMLFDAAKSKSDSVVKKIVSAPKAAVKKSEGTTDYKASKASQLMKKAKASGDIDDIVEALAASRNT